jgi:adenine-specific DNA-methyltransferase
MDKLDKDSDGISKDVVKENLEELKKIFPECFSDNLLNFDVLKELMGEYSEVSEERYSFVWPGKSEARRVSQTPSRGTLRFSKEKSVNPKNAQNLFIEGDNLEILKIMQKSYHKKIKLIYIDPPYNTGKEFIYPDRFQDNLDTYLKYTGQLDDEGIKFSTNSESLGRFHSNWLNMMYPRLKLARNLLKDDGVICISINDHEVSNLKKICEEIFGAENFIGQLIWKSRQNKDNRNLTGLSIDHEYILCFAKNNNKRFFEGTERDVSQYSNPDNDERGPWCSANMVGLLPEDQRPNCHYDLLNPETGILYKKPKMGWRYDKNTMSRLISENRILWPEKEDGRPRRKSFLSDVDSSKPNFTSIVGEGIYTVTGTKELMELFGDKYFDFPKPSDLIRILIQQLTDSEGGDIVLDFFAGSGSTAQAVIAQNNEDGGNRQFIACQLGEKCEPKSLPFKKGMKTIADIARNRIGLFLDSIDEKNVGFKYFFLDSSNIKKWDPNLEDVESSLLDHVSNIKEDRSLYDVLYEVILKYGISLTIPIEEHKISGNKVISVGFGALIICLDSELSLDTIEGIGKLKKKLEPSTCQVLFMDSGFQDDSVKVNAVQVLKQFGIEDVRSL